MHYSIFILIVMATSNVGVITRIENASFQTYASCRHVLEKTAEGDETPPSEVLWVSDSFKVEDQEAIQFLCVKDTPQRVEQLKKFKISLDR